MAIKSEKDKKAAGKTDSESEKTRPKNHLLNLRRRRKMMMILMTKRKEMKPAKKAGKAVRIKKEVRKMMTMKQRMVPMIGKNLKRKRIGILTLMNSTCLLPKAKKPEAEKRKKTMTLKWMMNSRIFSTIRILMKMKKKTINLPS